MTNEDELIRLAVDHLTRAEYLLTLSKAQFEEQNQSWESNEWARRKVIEVREAIAALPAVAASQPDDTALEIDLCVLMIEELEKAAVESPWVPNEYCMNEVISDCCAFLREDRDAIGQPADHVTKVDSCQPTTVDRFNVCLTLDDNTATATMERDEDGYWVRVSDYEALAAAKGEPK